MQEILLFLEKYNISQIHISDGILNNVSVLFKSKKFEYINKTRPVLFYGFYDNIELSYFKKHIGPKFIFWTGTDSSPNKLNILQDVLKEADKFLCVKEEIYNNLLLYFPTEEIFFLKKNELNANVCDIEEIKKNIKFLSEKDSFEKDNIKQLSLSNFNTLKKKINNKVINIMCKIPKKFVYKDDEFYIIFNNSYKATNLKSNIIFLTGFPNIELSEEYIKFNVSDTFLCPLLNLKKFNKRSLMTLLSKKKSLIFDYFFIIGNEFQFLHEFYSDSRVEIKPVPPIPTSGISALLLALKLTNNNINIYNLNLYNGKFGLIDEIDAFGNFKKGYHYPHIYSLDLGILNFCHFSFENKINLISTNNNDIIDIFSYNKNNLTKFNNLNIALVDYGNHGYSGMRFIKDQLIHCYFLLGFNSYSINSKKITKEILCSNNNNNNLYLIDCNLINDIKKLRLNIDTIIFYDISYNCLKTLGDHLFKSYKMIVIGHNNLNFKGVADTNLDYDNVNNLINILNKFDVIGADSESLLVNINKFIKNSRITLFNHYPSFDCFFSNKFAMTLNEQTRTDECLYKKYNFSKDKINITFIGSLQKRKGIYALIDLSKNINNNNIQFNIAGSNIEKIDFSIYKNINYLEIQKNTKEILEISDYFINLSSEEGIPISVLEAFKMKVAVISYKIDGFNDFLIDRFTIYQIRNHDILHEQINSIVKNNNDKKKITESAFNIYEKCFTFRNTLESMCNILLL